MPSATSIRLPRASIGSPGCGVTNDTRSSLWGRTAPLSVRMAPCGCSRCGVASLADTLGGSSVGPGLLRLQQRNAILDRHREADPHAVDRPVIGENADGMSLGVEYRAAAVALAGRVDAQ